MVRDLVKALIIFFMLVSIGYGSAFCETTIFVKRTKIVTNGSVRNVNDDAHYLTFANNVCYVSDAQGFAIGNDKVTYYQTENGIDCYYGDNGNGPCHYFVAADKSRINEKRDKTIYVYEKCSPTAQIVRRKVANNRNALPINDIHDYQSTPLNSQSTRRTVKRKTCLACDGSGRMSDRKEYWVQYDPTEKKWCDICGEVTFIHTHRRPLCQVCFGKGYIESY